MICWSSVSGSVPNRLRQAVARPATTPTLVRGERPLTPPPTNVSEGAARFGEPVVADGWSEIGVAGLEGPRQAAILQVADAEKGSATVRDLVALGGAQIQLESP